MKKKYSIFINIFIFSQFFLFNNPIHGQIKQSEEVVKPVIELKSLPFSLKQVRLLDGIFLDAQKLNMKYLLDLDLSRLVYNFRKNAGLPSNAIPLGGWEAPDIELRGHFTGHFLSACALMYSSTGDERLIWKADTVVNELAKCQDAIGKSGYLSAFPESFFDRVETGKPVWAPWYTMHKILAGLIDVYVHMGNKKSLETAQKMAGWIKYRINRLTDEQMQKMLRTEFGGMSDALYNLYSLTGNTDYRDLGKRFEQKSFFEPLAEHQDKLKGLHVNTQIPKIIGAARAYELTGDTYYKNIATFFWNQVVKARAYSTGGTSNFEYWRSEPYHLSDQLGPNDHENCCTHNLLKLTSHLFAWEADPAMADYYERALLNGIMGTQHPKEGGAFMYYVPMRSGLFRYFCEPESSFVCCSGTGIESYAKFGDNIYFHKDDELYVNQFIASELDWAEKGVKIIQHTKYPEEEGTSLLFKMKNATDFKLKIRIPYWATKENKILINGKPLETQSSPCSYFIINRTWKDGDKIELLLLMSLRIERLPDNPNRISIMYGPLVLAGALGDKLMNKDMKYGMRGDAGLMSSDGAAIQISKIATENTDPAKWIKPVKGRPLTFKTYGIGRPEDFTLIPFNQIYGERYAVYWDLFTPTEYLARLKKYELPPGIIDRFTIGDKVDEDEHDFQAYWIEKGDTSGRKWVKSRSWFRFDVNILPDRPNVLKAFYYGDESRNLFNLNIDGAEIKTARIEKYPGEFYSVDYDLPFEMTKGKDRIAISYKVPEKNKVVNIGNTTVQNDLSIFETPKFFGCEILEKNKKK